MKQTKPEENLWPNLAGYSLCSISGVVRRRPLLLLLSLVSPLCRISTLTFLRQTMSLGNTVLQLSWC